MQCSRCEGTRTTRRYRLDGRVVIVSFLVGTLLAYVWTGDLLHLTLQGVQKSALPLWKLLVPLVVLAGAAAAWWLRIERATCERCGAGSPGALWVATSAPPAAADGARRQVLRGLGAGGATLAAVGAGAVAAVARNWGWIGVKIHIADPEVEATAPKVLSSWEGSTVQNYRRLGRTNAMVSDISLGSGRIGDVKLARLALDRGVNYFDTAPDYARTGSEQILGEAMKGRRDKVFLATKFCVADGHLPDDTPVPKVIEAVEGSLRRLQTDYVDLIHIHACDTLDRLLAPNIHEAFDRLKEQGKARFLGFSSHTPSLQKVAESAIDSGRFDVMMLAYHHGLWPQLGELIERAHRADIGVVAMKTLKGAKHTNLADFGKESSAYSQAAFRWVLANPHVSCLVISFFAMQHVDEYLYASGQKPQPADLALLEKYDRLTRGDYCQPHCGECLDSCPEGLPINDVLRYRMYFKDYGWEKEGMRLYARLERDASLCIGCPAPCTNRCPIGVPIRQKMLDAHANLQLV